MEPIFGRYQVSFPDGQLNEPAKTGHLLKYWDISSKPDQALKEGIGVKFINGYVPTYSHDDQYEDRFLEGERSEEKTLAIVDDIHPGDPKTFSHIAAMALNSRNQGKGGFRGVQALGVMKADVDYLGMLLSCGMARREPYVVSIGYFESTA